MTSFALKWIAVVTMLIDHVGVTLVPNGSVWYIVCRSVGRIAFPLFAFMIAEGYFYTKDFKKYLLRMLAFTVVSEIPFDLMVSGTPVNWDSQSVFVTFTLALCGLYLFDRFAAADKRYPALLSLLGTALAAQFAGSDYGAFGILVVFIFYRYRGERRALVAWFSTCALIFAALNAVSVLPNTRGALLSMISGFEILALLPILLYNRKKGFSSKGWQYFFYVFYPVHMLILYLI